MSAMSQPDLDRPAATGRPTLSAGRQAPPPSLHAAAKDGDLELTAALLAGGADPNAADSFGYTVMHQAACQGHGLIIRALAAADADPNVQLANGTTPLQAAARAGCLAAVQTLLAAGADVTLRDSQGRSALHLAAGEDSRSRCAVCAATGRDLVVPRQQRMVESSRHPSRLKAACTCFGLVLVRIQCCPLLNCVQARAQGVLRLCFKQGRL